MQKFHICHVCGGEMHPQIESSAYTFQGMLITVDDVCVFRCVNCGEGILESEEIKRIEKILVQTDNNT